MKIILTQYSAYHLWANQQFINCIEKLPEDIQATPVTSSFPTLLATLLHMWDAESTWWQRIKLQEEITLPSQKGPLQMEEIGKGLMNQSKQWHEWILNAQEHMFDHEFIYYNSKKEKFKQPVYQVLIHLFNHATYHRGQLIIMLRQLEVACLPATDFIVWGRKRSII